jgi:pimeloyl-ACP methyl ester carboxylesterase
MSTFVLVHGAGGGAWCWDRVVPLLEQAGHKAFPLDLPGHGKDTTLIGEVTFQSYIDRACDTIDAQPERIVLLGHSMGGMVITQVAELRPDRISTLVYLNARILKDGESMFQAARENTDPAQSIFLTNVIMAEDGKSFTLKDEAIKDILYNDCSDEDVAWAKSLTVPEAIAPNTTPVHTTVERFGRVPRVYITCLRDRSLAPSVQKRLYTAFPCRRVITMDTSHSPFLSAPRELADHLLSL